MNSIGFSLKLHDSCIPVILLQVERGMVDRIYIQCYGLDSRRTIGIRSRAFNEDA